VIFAIFTKVSCVFCHFCCDFLQSLVIVSVECYSAADVRWASWYHLQDSPDHPPYLIFHTTSCRGRRARSVSLSANHVVPWLEPTTHQ